MSSYRLRGQSKMFVPWSLYLYMSTTNSAETISGQPFALGLLNSSISEKLGLRPSTSSVFRWKELEANAKIVTTPVTVWVGVLANTLAADVAYDSSNDILDLLKKHDISDIDVAYRESQARLLGGPELFAPVNDLHNLKDVIDPFTTALGMPIAALETRNMQGTMGFFFRVDDDLFGVTARHVLFTEDAGNDEYSYVAGPKKEVAVMNTKAFYDLLVSIRAHIGTLKNTVSVLKPQAEAYSKKVAQGGASAASVAGWLVTTQNEIEKKNEMIEELKGFYLTMRKEWTDMSDRIIGHVVWAPSISVSTPASGYKRDVCVIKLDAKKFLPNFKGNVVDLGTEIECGKFMYLMNPRDDAPLDFEYPLDRLFRLHNILSATEPIKPDNQDHKGDPVRFVIKRGSATQTTIGRLNGFDSYMRRYNLLGSMDSIEMAILSYDNNSGPFSKPGDSGAVVAGACAKFGGLLTGGTGPTDSSNITYATPMIWLWEQVIKVKYPRANLDFEILDN